MSDAVNGQTIEPNMPNIKDLQHGVNTGELSTNKPTTKSDADAAFLEQVRLENERRYGNSMGDSRQDSTEPNNEGTSGVVGDDSQTGVEVSEGELSSSEEGSSEDAGELDTESEDSDSAEGEEEVTLEVDPLAPKKKTKKENLKNLRIALKAERGKVAEYEATIAEKDEQLKELEKIDDLKQEIAEKDARLEKLGHYENIVTLYGTDGFKEKFYDSVDNIKAEVGKIAADYGVPEGVLDEAFKITNRKQLNEFLSNYFDTFAIQDIRGHVLEAQKIIADREQAEANPAKARKDLLKTVTLRKEAEYNQARQNIKSIGQNAWGSISTLYSNKESGVGILQEVDGNKEHNSLRNQILTDSSTEFGKVLSVLVENGLKELPVQAAQAIASRFQLGEAAAHAIASADALQKENKELRVELQKLTNYSRPLASGSGGSTKPSASPTEGLSGKSLAGQLIENAAKKLSA